MTMGSYNVTFQGSPIRLRAYCAKLLQSVRSTEQGHALSKVLAEALANQPEDGTSLQLTVRGAGVIEMLDKWVRAARALGLESTVQKLPAPGADDTLAREDAAQRAFEDYDFGDGISILDHRAWDTTDPRDYIKIAYAEYDGDQADTPERKISFHVVFGANGKVEDIYGLDVQTGEMLGEDPSSRPDSARKSVPSL